MNQREHIRAFASLLTGASIWGLIWFPYRYLAQHGFSGTLASAITYAVGLSIAGLIYFGWRYRARPPAAEPLFSWSLLLLAVCIGLTNVGFVWATIHGPVLRVVLLFYLCPLWTALLARWLLSEKLSLRAACVMLLGLAGALFMLWRPAQGWPLPQSVAEWIGLAAGVMFAVSNVLLRKIAQPSRELKTCWVLLGCTLIAALGSLLEGQALPVLSDLPVAVWFCLGLLGLILFQANWIVQYGIERLPANRVAVIYLFELIVAAASAWYLADETFGWQETVGAVLIAGSSILAAGSKFWKKQIQHD